MARKLSLLTLFLRKISSQGIKTNSARPENCRPTYAQSPPGSCTREGFVLLNREILNGRPLKIAHLFDLVKAFLRPFCRSRGAGLSSCFCGARPRGLCPCWVPGRSRPWRPPARRLCGPPRRGAFAPGLRAACVGRRPRRGPQKTRPAVAPPASPRLPACRPGAPCPPLLCCRPRPCEAGSSSAPCGPPGRCTASRVVELVLRYSCIIYRL